jgi:hypothetical protein
VIARPRTEPALGDRMPTPHQKSQRDLNNSGTESECLLPMYFMDHDLKQAATEGPAKAV